MGQARRKRLLREREALATTKTGETRTKPSFKWLAVKTFSPLEALFLALITARFVTTTGGIALSLLSMKHRLDPSWQTVVFYGYATLVFITLACLLIFFRTLVDAFASRAGPS